MVPETGIEPAPPSVESGGDYLILTRRDPYDKLILIIFVEKIFVHLIKGFFHPLRDLDRIYRNLFSYEIKPNVAPLF